MIRGEIPDWAICAMGVRSLDHWSARVRRVALPGFAYNSIQLQHRQERELTSPQETIAIVTASLLNSPVWTFWWD